MMCELTEKFLHYSIFFCNFAIKQSFNLLLRVNKLAVVNALTPLVPGKPGRKTPQAEVIPS